MIQRFAVKQYRAMLVHGNSTEAEISVRNVHSLALRKQSNVNVKQTRLVNVPQVRISKLRIACIKRKLVVYAVQHKLAATDAFAAKSNVNLHFRCNAESGVKFRFDIACCRVGLETDIVHVVAVEKLNPHALPDTAVGRIPATERFAVVAPTLLTARHSVVHCVTTVHHKGVLLLHLRSHIQCKGGKAALVTADVNAVEPHTALVIHRIETKQRAAARLSLAKSKVTFVPHAGVVVGHAYAACRVLVGKRYVYRLRQFGLSACHSRLVGYFFVEAKLPFAVKCNPIVAP